MKQFHLGFALFVGFVTTTALSATEFPWTFSKDRDGIQIYTKAIEGAKLAEFKGVTVINTPIEVIGMILRDIPAYTQWMSGCLESRIIEQFDDNNMINYYVQKTTWPVANRDIVLTATTQINWEKGQFTVNFQSIQDSRVPPRNGQLVRMKEMKGSWIVESLDSAQTRVTFMLKLDPAGAIPAFLVNANNNNFQYHTLLGLTRMATLPKYIEAANRSEDKKILDKYRNPK